MSTRTATPRVVFIFIQVLFLIALAMSTSCGILKGGSNAVDPTAEVGGGSISKLWGYLPKGEGLIVGEGQNPFHGGTIVEVIDDDKSDNRFKVKATLIVNNGGVVSNAEGIMSTTTVGWLTSNFKLVTQPGCGGRGFEDDTSSDLSHTYTFVVRCADGTTGEDLEVEITGGATGTLIIEPTVSQTLTATVKTSVKKVVGSMSGFTEGGIKW